MLRYALTKRKIVEKQGQITKSMLNSIMNLNQVNEKNEWK